MDKRYDAIRPYPLAFKLKTLREMFGFSQVQVAQMLNITQAGYSFWETGRSNPSMTSIEKIRKLYNLPLDFFLDEAVSREISRIKKGVST